MRTGVEALLACGLILVGGQIASAGWILIDDFEGYTAGDPLDGSGGWVASTVAGAGTIEDDPLATGNNVAQVTRIPYSDKGARIDLGANAIAEGATGTVFFQAMRVSTSSFSMGFADNAFPVTQDGTEGNMNVRVYGNGCRDAGTNRIFDNGSMGTNVWVNYWLVVDNQNDTFKVYQEGNDAPTQTLLQVGALTDFNFATDTANALQYFGWAVNQWGSDPDRLYMDNIYIYDGSGDNLSNPVPEPATMGLLGLGTLGIAALRRRRRK
jgi:hypothetical protein